MKFCVVGPVYPFRGGIAHHTALLCRRLAEKHDVHAITFKRLYPRFAFPGKSQTDPSRQPTTFEASAVIDPLNPFTWRLAGRLAQRQAPDFTLVQWWQPFFGPCLASVASRAQAESRVVFICHNVLPHENTPLDRVLTRWALRQGHGFIVHSKNDQENLDRLLPGAVVRRTVLPEFDLCPVLGIGKPEARASLGLDGRVILFFGLVREYKGVMDLIDAMALLRSRDVSCLIVGEFYDNADKYVSRIEQLGLEETVRVINRYVPNEEVEAYFAAADVVVLPYRRATQSAVLQLAYRFERPAIATTVGGLSESVDNGRTGLLVPPRDPKALAAAIGQYFDENLEPAFAAGIRREKDRFSWDRMIEIIESLGAEI